MANPVGAITPHAPLTATDSWNPNLGTEAQLGTSKTFLALEAGL